MKDGDTQYQEYISSFPSDELLARYFGADTVIDTLKGGKPTTLYDQVRYLYDTHIRVEAMRMIRHADGTGELVKPIVVFDKDGCAPWLRELLIEQQVYFYEQFESELAAEFKEQFTHGRLYAPDWWEWFVTGDIIGVRLAPGMKPRGGNRPKRSLDEVFGRVDKN